MHVGFIGLGNMGKGMVENLMKNSLVVFGYDINKYTRQKLNDKIAPVSETDLQKELDIGFDNYQILDNTSDVIEKSEVKNNRVIMKISFLRFQRV